jgi:hypothetical protein
VTLADYSLMLFAALNCARIVAYVPQIVRVCRDPNGARAVSLLTWSLFTAANVATVIYAVVVSGDSVVAGVFCLNGLGCFTIVALTGWKRFAFGRQQMGSEPKLLRGEIRLRAAPRRRTSRSTSSVSSPCPPSPTPRYPTC